MTRDEFDALVAAACAAIIRPFSLGDGGADAHDSQGEAQLLDAEAREFADAVDRDGHRIDYGEAVMLEGSNGVVVVEARKYHDAPIYWRTVAGKVDRLVDGTELLPVLQRTASGAHVAPRGVTPRRGAPVCRNSARPPSPPDRLHA